MQSFGYFLCECAIDLSHVQFVCYIRHPRRRNLLLTLVIIDKRAKNGTNGMVTLDSNNNNNNNIHTYITYIIIITTVHTTVLLLAMYVCMFIVCVYVLFVVCVNHQLFAYIVVVVYVCMISKWMVFVTSYRSSLSQSRPSNHACCLILISPPTATTIQFNFSNFRFF